MTSSINPTCVSAIDSTRERCAACQEVSPVGFHVPNEVWEAVVHPQFVHSILCVRCFVSRADEKLVAWDESIEFYPVSFVTHLNMASPL